MLPAQETLPRWMAYITRVCSISDIGVRARTRASLRSGYGPLLLSAAFAFPQLLLAAMVLLLGCTAKANGCRVEGKFDSDGVDVLGVFWPIRSMIKLILFICCCPCVCAAAIYSSGLYECIIDALDDAKDALQVCMLSSGSGSLRTFIFMLFRAISMREDLSASAHCGTLCAQQGLRRGSHPGARKQQYELLSSTDLDDDGQVNDD